MAGKLGSFLGGVASGAAAALSTKRPKKKVADVQPEELGYTDAQKESMSEPEELGDPALRADGGIIGYADGGAVEDKSKRRKQIDKGEEDALMADGGEVKDEKYGVSGKKVERDPRDMRKQNAPAIGVRAALGSDTMYLADGGMVYGNSPQGSYEASRYQENHSANPDAGMPGSSCTKRDYGK